jgi:hypothetical protein
MEQYNKNNYLNSFGKNQHKYRESHNYYKKNYSSNFYKYDDDYFPEKNKINKNIHKTSFNKINPTKKNPRITEFHKTEKNFEKEEKNLIINDSSKNEISISNKYDQKNISHSRTNLLNEIRNSINSYLIKRNFNKNNNNLNINQSYNNELYNNNYNYYNSIFNQQSKLFPYYNSVNNNNYYLYSLNPQQINNSINNYYINNSIIIYNNLNSNSNPNAIITRNSPNNQLKNIYPNSNIINNNINTSNIFNQYLSKNYSNLNNLLFSKNEEDSNLNSKKNSINDPKKENTCILEINLKFSNNKIYNFKLNRFDDLFETVQIFCQINRLNSNLYIPIIINIMKALNSIYGIYNLKLNEKEINEIQFLKYFYFNSKEDSLK